MNKLASVFERYVTTTKLGHRDPLSLSSNEDSLGLTVDSESLSTDKHGEGQTGISSSCERIVAQGNFGFCLKAHNLQQQVLVGPIICQLTTSLTHLNKQKGRC
ncbi:hypothetical protein DR999_PMT15262 [Platysternon megacephalum]|uniref:Uncharacterized protein n=1 Tax=Platysternon megacephalum TaxID=55544 RepID=A0A4D9DWT8_9SAUR|nr:hypothetical protein DR999_PMT15262 [Platysternon megacephalum]